VPNVRLCRRNAGEKRRRMTPRGRRWAVSARRRVYLAEEVVEPAEEDKTRARTDEIFTLFWGAGLIGCSKSSNRRSSNARARARDFDFNRSGGTPSFDAVARRFSRGVTVIAPRHVYVRVFLRGCLKNPRQHASSSCARTTKRRWRLATVDEYALVVDAWNNDAGIVVRACGRPDRTRSNRTNRSNR